MDRAYIEPLYLLEPTKKCSRTSVSLGLICEILRCMNLIVGTSKSMFGRDKEQGKGDKEAKA